ncbi:MAG: hypothetical protein HWE14_04880 [Flavobacteriia bacterium]|nr:hypothetical protein [Flavobacteriia bacterium]
MQRLLYSALTALAFVGIMSCVADDPTYPFRVKVVGEDGTPIQNATIVARVPLPNTNIRYEGVTGVAGTKSFEHNGGEVVLQVQVTKGESPIVGAGCGFIKLEPDQMVTTTIVMSNYDPSDPGCQ